MSVRSQLSAFRVDPRWIVPLFSPLFSLCVSYEQRIAAFLYLEIFVSYGLDEACALMAGSFRGLFSWAMRGWSYHLRAGQSLSKILGYAPKVWGELVPSVIALGETHGDIVTSLRYGREYFSSQQGHKDKIVQALIYPALVGIAMVFTLFILGYVFLPPLEEFFLSQNKELPWAARGLKYFTSHGWGLVLGIVLIGAMVLAVLRVWPETEKGIFYLPLVGSLRSLRLQALFFHHMDFLSQRNLHLWQNFHTFLGLSPYCRMLIQKISLGLAEGLPLSRSIRVFPRMPASYVHILKLGEQSGNLKETLALLATLSKQSLDQHLSLIQRMCEPVLILILGGLFVMILYATFLPLYEGLPV